MRNQPANTHNTSPTTGNQLSNSAAGPKRFNQTRAILRPRCGFSSGSNRPMIILVIPPKVLPKDAATTNKSGDALPAESKPTNKISEFPGNSVALRKLLPKREASARVLLKAYGHPLRPYWHAERPESQNQRLQIPRIFQVARRLIWRKAKKCQEQVCDSAHHWRLQWHQSSHAGLNDAAMHQPSNAHFPYLRPLGRSEEHTSEL